MAIDDSILKSNKNKYDSIKKKLKMTIEITGSGTN